MEIWAKTEEIDMNSACITVVGTDSYAKVQGHAVLRNGDQGSFTVRFEHNVQWPEAQTSSFDWLRDAIVAWAETL